MIGFIRVYFFKTIWMMIEDHLAFVHLDFRHIGSIDIWIFGIWSSIVDIERIFSMYCLYA